MTDVGCNPICNVSPDAIELHHIFPQQFANWFLEHGIDIEKFKIAMSAQAHRLKPDGLHTKLGRWNQTWQEWIGKNPGATQEEILEQGQRMLKTSGVLADDLFLQFNVVVNRCMVFHNCG